MHKFGAYVNIIPTYVTDVCIYIYTYLCSRPCLKTTIIHIKIFTSSLADFQPPLSRSARARHGRYAVELHSGCPAEFWEDLAANTPDLHVAGADEV